jgi:hypothetical protein
MRKVVLKSATAVAIAVALVAGATANVKAIDSKHRYFAYGLGERSCEDYVKFREKKLEKLEGEHPRFTKDELYEIVDRVVGQWIAGFLTAHNLYVSDTYNVAGTLSMDDVKARLEKNCRADTRQHFTQAMIKLVQEFASATREIRAREIMSAQFSDARKKREANSGHAGGLRHEEKIFAGAYSGPIAGAQNDAFARSAPGKKQS